MTKVPLVRENGIQPDTVIIIGNGVFKNGWEPIERLLTSTLKTQLPGKDWFCPKENLALFISYYGEQLRTNRHILLHLNFNRILGQTDPSDSQQAEKEDKKFGRWN